MAQVNVGPVYPSFFARALQQALTQAARGGRLPANEDELQALVQCPASEWRQAWPKIRHLWRVEGDLMVPAHLKRSAHELDRTARKQRAYRARRAGNATQSVTGNAPHNVTGNAGGTVTGNDPGNVTGNVTSTLSPRSPLPSPPHPLSDPLSPPSPPPHNAHVREAKPKPPRLAFGGKSLEIPKFLDAEFAKRIGTSGFDLSGFYLALDEHLQRTGEPWDLAWVRARFDAAQPAPDTRRRTTAAPQPKLRSTTTEAYQADLERQHTREQQQAAEDALLSQLVEAMPAQDREKAMAAARADWRTQFPRMQPREDQLLRWVRQELADTYRSREQREFILARWRRQAVSA